MAENKCGYQMYIFVTSLSSQHAPVWWCFCMVQPLRQPFSPHMHQQNPADAPPESHGTIRIRRTLTESCLHLRRDFKHCSTSGPRTGFFNREPDFQKILKKPQNKFSWCFLSVSSYFWHCSTSEPRTGFLSREPGFQKILKKPQNIVSWCFMVF